VPSVQNALDLNVPFTSSLYEGDVVPIPTLPPVVTNNPAEVEELSPHKDKPLLPTKPLVALAYPLTSNFCEGDVVPIPTLPTRDACGLRGLHQSQNGCPDRAFGREQASG
jgi:hypothetical protein